MSCIGRVERLFRASCRYKLRPVICPSGWLSPFNFSPGKISHPSGHQHKPLMFKIAPGNFVFRAPCPPPFGPSAQTADVQNCSRQFCRTPDILLPKQARYQTALYPDTPDSHESGGGEYYAVLRRWSRYYLQLVVTAACSNYIARAKITLFQNNRIVICQHKS